MAKIQEGLALGIGVQSDQFTVNTNVSTATQLITGVASGSGATGILVRNNSDFSVSFEREESEGGRVPGSLTRMSGVLKRTVPAFSFVIDWMGRVIATTTPIAGEYDPAEYMVRILAANRLDKGTSTSSDTPFEYATDASGAFHTLKLWRGTGAGTESWTLVGCTFNLTWDHTPNDKSTLTVEVIADSVIFLASDTFPTNATDDLPTAFGNQRLAAPICQLAGAALDGITRGFQTASITSTYDVVETLDSNVATGKLNEQGQRTVEASVDFFADTLETVGDFPKIEDNLDQTSAAPAPKLTFIIGQVAGAGDIANAMELLIPSWRITGNEEVTGDNEQVVRRVTGYAAPSGDDASFGTAANEEQRVSFV